MRSSLYFSYFKSESTIELVRLLRGSLSSTRGFMADPVHVDSLQVRAKISDIFVTPEYLGLAATVALEVAELCGIYQDDALMQIRPSFRVFTPGSHSTSLHCDYWYGHGTSARTVWLSLTENPVRANFWLCRENRNELILSTMTEESFSIGSISYDERDGFFVDPPVGGAVVFSSLALHASPRNDTESTRVSIDFRVMSKRDKTSTKEDSLFASPTEILARKTVQLIERPNRRLLKYILGGHGPSTQSQHILIDGYARAHNLNVVGQEAEIERMNYPMLRLYLSGLAIRKGLDGIIISSKMLLSSELMSLAKESCLLIIFALENEILDQ